MTAVLDLAWRMHDQAASAIDKADTKAGFAATVETALAAVVLTLTTQSHGAPIGARVLFGLALIGLAVALASALLVVIPRLHRPTDQLVPGEFLYFGAVRLRSIEQLRQHIVNDADGEYEVAKPWEAVSHHAKRLAAIAWTKHRWLRVSFLAAILGAVFSMAGVLVGGVA
ncbi:Pycsar system effector family protein [Kribbella sp. NPDC006257]|uniref:Pycsar system effector family protein n=1 Tax=Kribbella sp. NPDC006257 TaxID=3156738 RepID=UPI0033A4E800